MKNALFLLILALSLCGCSSTGSNTSAKSRSATEVAVFQEGTAPERQFTVLGTLKDDAREEEEEEVTEQFKKKARKMGGDAIVFKPKKESGFEGQPFSFKVAKTYLYTVDVIKFQ